MRTDKEVFEIVKNHLLTQKEPSQIHIKGDIAYTCAYRGYDGAKCAIGCLIDDKDYYADLETYSIKTIFERLGSKKVSALLNYDVNVGSIHFLTALQKLHDEESPDNWEKCLNQFYKDWKLDR